MKRIPFFLLPLAVALACSDTATSPEFRDMQASNAEEAYLLSPPPPPR